MYHFFVRRMARWAFERLNSGDYEAFLKGFTLAPDFTHTFAGNHALGGIRHSEEGMRRWFERLFRLFPGLNFEIKDILVQGWPWNTVVAVEWIDRAKPKDGQPYVNEGVHVLRLRQGRLVEVHAYLDSQKVEAVCQRLAQQGVSEAVAPPIED